MVRESGRLRILIESLLESLLESTFRISNETARCRSRLVSIDFCKQLSLGLQGDLRVRLLSFFRDLLPRFYYARKTNHQIPDVTPAA
jgi:hypothetical protein